MAKVAVVMGSESDREVVQEVLPFFAYFNIGAELFVMSAHRTPEKVKEFAASAQETPEVGPAPETPSRVPAIIAFGADQRWDKRQPAHRLATESGRHNPAAPDARARPRSAAWKWHRARRNIARARNKLRRGARFP